MWWNFQHHGQQPSRSLTEEGGRRGVGEHARDAESGESQRDGGKTRAWVHLIIKHRLPLPHPVHFSYPCFCSYPQNTHTHLFTHKLLQQDPASPQSATPTHLCVLGWIMQGLYPALKHEWIIWPQEQVVSTFPSTFLFIYLLTRRTWGGMTNNTQAEQMTRFQMVHFFVSFY